MGGQRIRTFSAKMTPQGKKMTFFGFFFFCCTSSRRDETFLFLAKFHIFSRLDKSWGDKQNVNFRLKTTPQAKKITFSGFFSCCISTYRDEFFLFLSKFHIFNRSEKSWGDKEKRYIEQQQRRTNDERTTNERTTNDERRRRRRTTNDDERRTTWTMIIPRQDSQNPRANKS